MTLVWPGKERERSESRVIAGDLRVVERVDPSRLSADAEPQGHLALASTASADGANDAWRDLLLFGDNYLAMQTLTERVRGKIDLVYIDPPYATGLSYFSQTGRSGASLERRAYRDTLTGGMAGYADTMYERLSLMRELLADTGKIFVHCDWRASAVLRLLLDELFGTACYRNEIIWRRAPNLGRQAASKQLGRVFDSILVYSKSEGAPFPGPVPKRRTAAPLDGKGKPKGARWDEARALYFTTAPRGDYTDKSIARLREEGRVYDSSAGKVYIKYFLTKGNDGAWYKEQPVDALWDDYEVRPLRHRPKSEAMGYDTQKPEGLLERIISWATRPGDLVADFFCGSGTTAAVAHGMGRRFIACDRQRTAIEITRRRLLDRGASFDVCSVMRGERRRWAEGEENDARLVLEAFGATFVAGRWGKKDPARVFVGPPTEAMTEAAVAAACAEAGGGSVEVLAWEWSAHDPSLLRGRMKKEHGVDLVMRTIPVDLMREMTASAQLLFLERPEIDLEMVHDGEPAGETRQFAVRITDVRCPETSRLREDKSNKGDKQATTPLIWSDYIDTWRVDFDGSSEPFAPTWQAARVGSQLTLTTPPRAIASLGQVKVKVFTVFGDEVDRTLEC